MNLVYQLIHWYTVFGNEAVVCSTFSCILEQTDYKLQFISVSDNIALPSFTHIRKIRI